MSTTTPTLPAKKTLRYVLAAGALLSILGAAYRWSFSVPIHDACRLRGDVACPELSKLLWQTAGLFLLALVLGIAAFASFASRRSRGEG